jgi:hypothetical protein
VVRLQDPSIKGEISNPIEEVWIGRLITAAVENTTIGEREGHTHTHRKRQTDRQIERHQKEGARREMPSAWAELPPNMVADEHGGRGRRTIADGATVTADHHHPPTRTATSS